MTVRVKQLLSLCLVEAKEPSTHCLPEKSCSCARDVLKRRRELDRFHRLMQELRLDAHRFHGYFRLSTEQFDYLLRFVIGPRISRRNSDCFTLVQIFSVFLFYFLSVCFYLYGE